MDFIFGYGGGCGNPQCPFCSSSGEMGGPMPPFSLPPFGMPPFMPCGPACTGECQNNGRGGGFPGIMSGGMDFPGVPPQSTRWPGMEQADFPTSGGPSFPGSYPPSSGWPGTAPSNSIGLGDRGGATTTEIPFIYPLGTTGLNIDMIIDTGASLTLITPESYNKHFPGIPVLTDKQVAVGGFEGGVDHTYQRFMMPLAFNVDNRQIKVEGEAWICNNGLDVECLLGLPFLRANHMSLEWGSNGEPDSIMVQGEKIPIETQVDVVQYQVGAQTGRKRQGRLLRVGGKRK